MKDIELCINNKKNLNSLNGHDFFVVVQNTDFSVFCLFFKEARIL